MLWRLPKRTLITMAVATALAILASSHASAAPVEACVSPAPGDVPVKVLNIFNNSRILMYVVLETAKQDLLDANGLPYDRWLQAEFNPTPGRYASTYLYRAYINPLTGIPPGAAVQVTVPFYTQIETSPCPFDLDQYINWWRALRVYVYDDPGAIAHAYDGDTNPQNAASISPPGGIASCPACDTPLVVHRIQTGSDGHRVSLPPGDPSQLLEFTFALVPEPPQPLSINYAFVDYDISSVDQVYLPVAMDPLDNPYIGYIGSVLGRTAFGKKLGLFRKDFGWPKYHWPSYVTNQSNLRLPGAFNVM